MPLYRSFVLRVSHFPQDESTVRPIKKFNGFAVLDFSIWFYKKKKRRKTRRYGVRNARKPGVSTPTEAPQAYSRPGGSWRSRSHFVSILLIFFFLEIHLDVCIIFKDIRNRRRQPIKSAANPIFWNVCSDRWTRNCWWWKVSTSFFIRRSDRFFLWWGCTSSRWGWMPPRAAFS